METPEQQLAALSPEQRRMVELWLRRELTEPTQSSEPAPATHISRRAVASLADYMITTEKQPGRTDKIARALQRIKAVSAEDRHKLLEQKRAHEVI